MTDYIDLIRNSETWLMNRILEYAEKFEFTKYTSTLAEAWRLSISGISGSLIVAANHYSDVIPELHPDDKYIYDPISEFGIIEAQKHRKRGTTLAMFLGLMKYYNESYIDLLEQSFADETKKQFYKKFTQRCFNRIEIAYCVEWTSQSGEVLLNELQDSNRKITNEKNKYLTIFESMYVPIILLDEDVKISNLNQAATELFTNLKIAGSIYYNDSSSPLSFKQLHEQILRFIGSNPSETDFESWLTTNKGELLFQVKLKKMQDVSKKFSGTVIMLDDITERKKAELLLKESEHDLQERVKELNGIYSLGLSAEKFEKLEDICNEFVNCIVPESMQFPEKAFVSLEIESKKYCNIENFNLQKKRKYLSAPVNIFGKQSGELMIAYTDDLPFIKLYEQKLIDSYAGRLSRIAERIKTRQVLEESEKQLQQLNKDKDLFISILSHDLRSPFNNLLGLSELLSENIHLYDPDKIKSLAVHINKSAVNTFNLLEDILMWARSQSGKIPFEPENLDFKDICRNSLETLIPTANTKGIKIKYNESDRIVIFADINMLKTILRNLVSNAIKFTNHGGVINISAKKENADVTITVSDNGIGIHPGELSKLFDISQVYTTAGTAKERGTGLGLILCREFVEKHGGKIWAVSEYGKGSELNFTLPTFDEQQMK